MPRDKSLPSSNLSVVNGPENYVDSRPRNIVISTGDANLAQLGLQMDSKDKELLNLIQAGFPVEPHPYKVIGEKIGITDREVLDRIVNLKKEGIIRRMGASINSRRVGFVSTLLAAKVPPDKFDFFVNTVNSVQGVTHNYERRHEYNVWFTLISQSAADKDKIIMELTEKTGIPILELPATRIFKIRVDFKF